MPVSWNQIQNPGFSSLKKWRLGARLLHRCLIRPATWPILRHVTWVQNKKKTSTGKRTPKLTKHLSIQASVFQTKDYMPYSEKKKLAWYHWEASFWEEASPRYLFVRPLLYLLQIMTSSINNNSVHNVTTPCIGTLTKQRHSSFFVQLKKSGPTKHSNMAESRIFNIDSNGHRRRKWTLSIPFHSRNDYDPVTNRKNLTTTNQPLSN